MSGPVVLVTGGARRIGRAICEDLARAGWRVVVHVHEAGNDAGAVIDAIAGAGGKCALVSGDLSDSAVADGLYDAASDAFGAPDVVVNNASAFLNDDADKPDFAQFDLHFALHVKAP